MVLRLLAIALLHWAVLPVPALDFVLIGQAADAGGARRLAALG